ncbi:hypothetical protein DYBT9275_02291 [Dyadobacter sp. CECT 9275]|uniref:Methyltransferase domain-containing protein n=1 Tax=Dyadobacter helix TaxID=2822344 RepID=A0A916JBX5_9BACT|nr:class I SAM-dependent methyltransferase [Dyadobacter sp. CECT 9275]CAG4999733.1 hypothetical protein DYBT9275_02291 [Dyadobacter sp. CECT 9275]
MEEIVDSINRYYSEKIVLHGATPKGVDWNSVESQELRYKILSKVINDPYEKFSVLDYGCGFGGLYNYYREMYTEFTYTGFDISSEMIHAALNINPVSEGIVWTNEKPVLPHEYVVCSGIFNVKLDNNEKEWCKYIIDTLEIINNLSIKGFSFNILTKYSDREYMKDYLFYADPMFFFDYCKKHFSRNVALLHDYDLYEFTLLIRK